MFKLLHTDGVSNALRNTEVVLRIYLTLMTKAARFPRKKLHNKEKDI